MTYAIFAIVASAISPSGCSAYTYQAYSERPYVRAPWFQFSEQLLDNFEINGGFHPAFPFLTGHGGANQVVLFGYLGLRLIADGYLHIDPTLPPQIPQIRYRTFYWQGWPIQAYSNHTATTLTRLPTPLDTANATFANSPIPIIVGAASNSTSPILSLPPNGTLAVSNRMPADIQTVSGNLAQCQRVWSTNDVVPGQFAISAVDGTASTKWQPNKADVEASITVELASGEAPMVIAAFFFDWAQAPPVSFRVEFHNGSSSSGGDGGRMTNPSFYDPSTAQEIAFQDPVRVSSPFDPTTVADVVPYSSNTTLVTLDTPVAVGGEAGARYATLWIRGNQGIVGEDKFNSSEPGAEVAEWAIIVEGEDTGGNQRRDLAGGAFKREMEKKREAGAEAAQSEKVIKADTGTMHMTMTDAARDAELRRYGGYIRRAAEERRRRRRKR